MLDVAKVNTQSQHESLCRHKVMHLHITMGCPFFSDGEAFLFVCLYIEMAGSNQWNYANPHYAKNSVHSESNTTLPIVVLIRETQQGHTLMK